MSKKKMSILDFKKYKEEGKKFTYVTAYDYTMASIVNDSDTEVILVGDSLGMIITVRIHIFAKALIHFFDVIGRRSHNLYVLTG